MGLRRGATRRFAAKSENDSGGGAEVVLARKVEVAEMAGVDVIDRAQLHSYVVRDPIIDAGAGSERQRVVRQGTPVVHKCGIVFPNQAMDKECELGAFSKVITRPKHVGEIAAVVSGGGIVVLAIVDAVAADVCLGGKVMKAEGRNGEVPAVHTQPGRSRTQGQVSRLIKAVVGEAAKYIDGRKVLSGSDAQKKKGSQSEVDKFFHVPKRASRKFERTHNLTEYRTGLATRV